VNPHPHVRLDFHSVLERSRLDSDGFKPRHRRGAMRIHLLIDAITIHIGPEVQALLVELLDCRGDFDRKPDDLIWDELFLQRSAWL